ncbi:phosphotransferase [Terrabacter sp. GCM10028922]|uniref:phosphotransferase n=1 Tax=Terrabacter sp. GCM10028922 TaxID=3273428 RepID=UPI0036D79404
MASSHEPVDSTLVGLLLEQHFHIGGQLERLATEKDDSFILRAEAGSYLVKVSPPSEPEMVVALQTAVMRFLQDTAPELPIQRVVLTPDGDDNVVLESDDGRTRVLRVFDFVDGAVLARTSPDATQLAKVGEVLGRIDLALKGFHHPAARRGLIWDTQHFHHLTGLLAHTTNAEHRQLAREVFRLFDDAIVPRLDDLETQVIHGDYSPHNVVVDPQGDDFVAAVIDFGDTVHSAVICDPAVAMANLLGREPGQPWRDACAFMVGYERARPIRDSELALLPVAALARLTLRALITNWRAVLVPERRDYLLDHARDDWVNVERALAVPLDDVVALLRSGREGGI